MYIFKPNKNNNGSALGINFGPDSKKGLACYLKIIRQDANSWNGQNGSFKANTSKESPNNVSVKLNNFEVGNIILTIRSNGKIPFKAYHGSQNGNVQINLNPAPNSDPNRAPVFFLGITKNGSDKFFIPLTLPELETLRVFLEHGLHKVFDYEDQQNPNQNNRQSNGNGGGYQNQGYTQPPQQSTQPPQQPPQPPQQPTQQYNEDPSNSGEIADDPFDYDNPF